MSGACKGKPPACTRRLWEYKFLDSKPGASDAQLHVQLNALGLLGWELVGVDPTGREWTYFLKREILPGLPTEDEEAGPDD